MLFEQIQVGRMGNYAYLVGTQTAGEALVVDPGFDSEKILNAAKKHELKIRYIILTHHHYDHVDTAMSLKSVTGAEILAHEETERLLKGKVKIDRNLSDGESFMLEASDAEIKVLHTPGHAPGSICLVIDNKWLITGDTLFIGTCGRTDLPGGNSRVLFESMQKIKALPDHLIVMSGHDYGSVSKRSLGEEKKLNPVLISSDFEAFDILP
ncbi:MAG: MBL fold metallo-hydrolase [Candidatus Riflebacteria bacterium]|nr:MBL fold metallo-hydrolase [Candidatus Riflebacteria bacterium]